MNERHTKHPRPVGIRAREHRELALVAATAGLYFIFYEVLDVRVVFIILASLGWGSYLAWSARNRPRIVRDWGLGTEHFKGSLAVTTAVSLPALGAMALIATAAGRSLGQWHLACALLLYPVWGLLQQFLLQALIARNLRRRTGSATLTVLSAALLFGALHLPNLPLAGLTFLLAAAFVPIYLRWPNLYPLGLYHGWLAALAYYGLLGEDPWAQVMCVL